MKNAPTKFLNCFPRLPNFPLGLSNGVGLPSYTGSMPALEVTARSRRRGHTDRIYTRTVLRNVINVHAGFINTYAGIQMDFSSSV
jgi:hypothetical protein